jgi:hypothetical protein
MIYLLCCQELLTLPEEKRLLLEVINGINVLLSLHISIKFSSAS